MKKVVIIGAGPAGLTAGYELISKSNDYEVEILEESSQVGGISRTVNYKGNLMDLGGHRFVSNCSEVTKWWDSFMPMQGAPAYDDLILNRDVKLKKDGPNPETDDVVRLSRASVSHIYFNKRYFDYPMKMNSETFKYMGLGSSAKANFSRISGAVLKKRKEESIEDFYINKYGRAIYQAFFEGYLEKLWGRHPSQVSPDWAVQREKGVVNKKKEREGDAFMEETFTYPKLGPGQMWETVAAKFIEKGGKIYYNCKVNRVTVVDHEVTGIGCTIDGEKINMTADIVISSMPIKDLVDGMSEAPLNVREVAHGLPYRDFISLGLLLPKIKLTNKSEKYKTVNNITPDCWIGVQDSAVKLGKIQIFNNWSPYMVSDSKNTVWMSLEYYCNEGDFYWNMSEKAWIEMATQELIRMDIIDADTQILDHCKVEVKKAYPAYYDTYHRLGEVKDYLNTITNLYCIGRNGQHKYNSMDHSMETAFEAVKLITGKKGRKADLWEVSVEKIGMEEKKNATSAYSNHALLADDDDDAFKAVPPSRQVAPVTEEDKIRASQRKARRTDIAVRSHTSVATETTENKTLPETDGQAKIAHGNIVEKTSDKRDDYSAPSISVPVFVGQDEVKQVSAPVYVKPEPDAEFLDDNVVIVSRPEVSIPIDTSAFENVISTSHEEPVAASEEVAVEDIAPATKEEAVNVEVNKPVVRKEIVKKEQYIPPKSAEEREKDIDRVKASILHGTVIKSTKVTVDTPTSDGMPEEMASEKKVKQSTPKKAVKKKGSSKNVVAFPSDKAGEDSGQA